MSELENLSPEYLAQLEREYHQQAEEQRRPSGVRWQVDDEPDFNQSPPR